jgi:hypothetical protein
MDRQSKHKGRPTKCDEKIIAEISKLLKEGHFARTVCDFVGISEPTYYGWTDRGRAELERIEGGAEPIEKEAIYVTFFKSIVRAAAEVEIDALRQIAAHGTSEAAGDFRALTWFMERRYQNRWGAKREVQVGMSKDAWQSAKALLGLDTEDDDDTDES